MVNLDTRSVAVPPTATLPALPAEPQATFLAALQALSYDYELAMAGSCSFAPERDHEARELHSHRLHVGCRQVFLRLMLDLFGDVRKHIMYDLTPPVFSTGNFLQAFPADSHEFFRTVFATSSFRSFQRSRHHRERDYFDIMAGSKREARELPTSPPYTVELPPFADAQSSSRRRSSLGSTVGFESGSLLNQSRLSDVEAEPSSPPVAPGTPRTPPRVVSGGGLSISSGDAAPPMRSVYCRSAIAIVSQLIESEARSPTHGCLAQMFQLRAIFKIWEGNVLEGLDDFGEVRKLDASSFPTKHIIDVIQNQPPSVRNAIRMKGQTWEDFCDHVDAEQESLDFTLSPICSPARATVKLPEIGGIPEVLAAVRDGDGIDESSFIAVCKVLGITDDSQGAKTLFESLSSAAVASEEGGARLQVISVELFVEFVETWNGIRDLPVNPLDGLVELEDGEMVLKVQPLVRTTTEGIGTLVLTHRRLFLVPNNEKSPYVEICRLKHVTSIEKFQYKVIIPPGVPALRIVTVAANKSRPQSPASSRPSSRRSSIEKQRSLKRNSSESVVFNETAEGVALSETQLLFWSERDAWFGYLSEMREAYRVASEPNAPLNTVYQAAKNIDLAEVVHRITMQRQLGIAPSGKGLSPSTYRRRLTRPSSQVFRMLPLSNPQNAGLKPLSDEVSFSVVTRVELQNESSQTATVECMLFVQESGSDGGGTVWCGLGSGEVQVLEVPSCRFDTRMVLHAGRVTALLCVGDHVWTGSFDASICVVDARSRRSVTVLNDLDDAVSCLWSVVSSTGEHSVWSGTLSGTLDEWDPRSHRRLRTVTLPLLHNRLQSVTSVAQLEGSLWVGTGTNIVVLDSETLTVKVRHAIAPPDSPPQTMGGLARQVTAAAVEKALSTLDGAAAAGDSDGDSAPALPASTPTFPATPQRGGASSSYSSPPGSPESVSSQVSDVAESPIQRFYDNDLAIIRTSAASCLVVGDPGTVWSCSSKSGLLQVWNTETYEPVHFGGRWRLDCGGFNCLVRAPGAVWGGANDGSVYLWDPESRMLIKHLTAHADGVRSLCVVGDEYVLSGAGSRDGSVVVWNPR